MSQKIVDFWMHQNEGLKICYVVLIVLILFWLKGVVFGSSEDNGVLDGRQGVAIIDTNGKPVKATPCDGDRQPKCRIFEEGFNTVDLLTVTIHKGERPDNTTCTITYIINGKKYITEYEIPDGQKCPTT